MSTVTRPRGVHTDDGAHFVGAHAAFPAIEYLAARSLPARVLVSGNAGSGKTAVLQHAEAVLSAPTARLDMLGDDAAIDRVPDAHVLLVDDLHLLNDVQIEAVRRRSANRAAGLVVASRPWPRSEASSSIARHLERSQPAIVLGRLSRSDVRGFLEERGESAADSCLDHILEATGGVSWLVTRALVHHDTRGCAGGAAHADMSARLEESIAHRLDSLDERVRRVVESVSLESLRSRGPAPEIETDIDELLAEAYAEGLLLRNGRSVPVVHSAVRATISTRRLLSIVGSADDGFGGIDGDHDWLARIRDPRLSTALADSADRSLTVDPARAERLYAAAEEAGAEPAAMAPNRAIAAWARGDLDTAAALVDLGMTAAHDEPCSSLAETGAAVWSARGMLAMGCGLYRALPPKDADSLAKATITRMGAGEPTSGAVDASALTKGQRDHAPTTLGVALALLRTGLESSLRADGAGEALADLVRASALYTSSRSTAPIAELPAVIATVVAINLGDLPTARAVLDAAIAGDQGGPWARPRLLLWSAWVSVLEVRPAAAQAALSAATEYSPELSPRDDLLAEGLRLAIARRWQDTAALTSVWSRARGRLRRVDIDLYLLHPLAEFVSAASRLKDDSSTAPHYLRALSIVERMKAPPLWSAHLRWAGIQHGILAQKPETLNSHARALVEAAPTSEVAATMASAGRTWTSVLAGSVDADAVEAAAQGLASLGLAWDAARLAGQAAKRTSDRKDSARLLARARELHPQDSGRAPAAPADDRRPNADRAAESTLSDREVDVARLVVEGKTYAEIGETIFISPRTAEHHIASIRRRLGATSRSDLIAKLRLALQSSSASDARAEG